MCVCVSYRVLFATSSVIPREAFLQAAVISGPGAALESITRGPRGFIKGAAYLRIECSGGLAPAGARGEHPPDQVEVETAAGEKRR